ncbi:hypothetical protein AQ714_30115 [Burkholderia pseudomallei]|nr:hypothetical protein AQ709_29400 [Burkholderia pseudomallei]OMQ66156.1 hypothetical protein AQ711_05985 [Burkholderia pseudomallei]OMQ69605.1 hypothetical protein AQ712_04675 [Burkholderia pseudomallei]OMQ83460.1 hypothetical protein AQ714_30115 [Burkholderia pseudomallei]OMR07401.1 hypothetical protein AQ719_05330 [Burkholderia pseudomallei]
MSVSTVGAGRDSVVGCGIRVLRSFWCWRIAVIAARSASPVLVVGGLFCVRLRVTVIVVLLQNLFQFSVRVQIFDDLIVSWESRKWEKRSSQRFLISFGRSNVYEQLSRLSTIYYESVC